MGGRSADSFPRASARSRKDVPPRPQISVVSAVHVRHDMSSPTAWRRPFNRIRAEGTKPRRQCRRRIGISGHGLRPFPAGFAVRGIGADGNTHAVRASLHDWIQDDSGRSRQLHRRQAALAGRD